MAAWSLLGFFRLLVAMTPFTFVRRLLGEDRGAHGSDDRPTLDVDQRWRAARISEIVQRAAARTPWTSDCFPQALTARTFLAARRIPHVVDFGVRREAGGLAAHTWVSAGDVPVTGGDGTGWTRVGRFVWTAR
nr:lasso peptide biosynthesis B2 protein [Nocardioides daejeonensis]